MKENKGVTETAEAQRDPLDQTCGETDTSFPLLQGDKIYRFTVKDGSLAPSKKGGQMLVFKCTTNADAVSTKGEHIGAGYPLTHRISITPTPDYDMTKIGKNIAAFAKACGKGTLTPRQIINGPSSLNGSTFDAKIVVKPEKDGFPEGNEFKQFVPAS